jgi:AraC family transcriptional activator of pobA
MDEAAKCLYISNMNTMEIQNYTLFGEATDLPDVVHCETIAERSLLHDWEFTPHRHSRLHQFLMIDQGGGQALIEGARVVLAAGQIVNMPAGAVHGFSFQPGTDGWVITVGSEVLDHILDSRDGVMTGLSAPNVTLGNQDISFVFKRIFQEYTGQNFARAPILRALVAELAALAARLFHDLGQQTGDAQGSALLKRFDDLLEAHYAEHWDVAHYARALALSPTHLGRKIRAATGQPPSKRIETRLIREARRQLAYTNLSVSQIAYALGYIDPAYFSRVFTRAVGQPPSAFRNRLERAGTDHAKVS